MWISLIIGGGCTSSQLGSLLSSKKLAQLCPSICADIRVCHMEIWKCARFGPFSKNEKDHLDLVACHQRKKNRVEGPARLATVCGSTKKSEDGYTINVPACEVSLTSK